MSTDVLRRPVRGEELEQFERIVADARRARRTRADFLTPVVDGDDVLLYCINPGGKWGKRYRYADWLEAFDRDLREGFFLAA